jgi:hypothetical protein
MVDPSGSFVPTRFSFVHSCGIMEQTHLAAASG